MVVWMRMLHRGLCPVVLLCMAFLLAGTSSYAAAPEEEKEGSITQAELQSTLMGFADTFGATIIRASINLEKRAQSRQARFEALVMRVYPFASVVEIAAGPNPEAALLDMVVMVTLNRIVWEDYWGPKVFGDVAEVMIKPFRQLEGEIWRIAATVLTPAQQQELRDLIQGWRRAHPEHTSVNFIRFSNLDEARRESTLAGAERSAGFMGIKAATRAADEIRLVADRALWQTSRLYLMADFKMDLAIHKLLNEPKVEQVTQAIGKFAKMADELPNMAKIADELPKKIAEERKATIGQVVEQIEKQRNVTFTQLAKLIEEERSATVDQVMGRVATERKATIDYVMEAVARERKDLITQTFYRGVVLILIFFATMLVYRFTSEKLLRLGQGKRSS